MYCSFLISRTSNDNSSKSLVRIVVEVAQYLFYKSCTYTIGKEHRPTAVVDQQNLLIEDGTDIDEFFRKTLLNISSTK